MKTNQPQLPFSAAPINWLEPVAFKFNQLRLVTAAADKAGFRIIRLKVISGGYEAHFERNQSTSETQPPAVVTPPDNQNAASVTPAYRAGVNRLDAFK